MSQTQILLSVFQVMKGDRVSKSHPIYSRRHPRIFLKFFIEKMFIGIAAQQYNLRNRKIGIFKQVPCFIDFLDCICSTKLFPV